MANRRVLLTFLLAVALFTVQGLSETVRVYPRRRSSAFGGGATRHHQIQQALAPKVGPRGPFGSNFWAQGEPPLRKPTYGHVIVSLQKDESEFVVEWINYHLWLGFDHIFMYVFIITPACPDIHR